MTTITDVANHANVSAASVTRVLNGHEYISEELRDKVMQAVKELNYRPDLLAAGLRSGRTKTIGVVVSNISNPIHSEIIARLENELSKDGYSVLLANSHGSAAQDVQNVRLLSQRRIDGLVVMCADERSTALQREIDSLKIPVILFDRQLKHCDDVIPVLADHRGGTCELTGGLIDAGHEKIALLLGSRNATYPAREHLAGFKLAHTERGKAVDDEQVYAATSAMVARGEPATPKYGAEVIAAMVEAKRLPSAIVVGVNTSVSGVILELQRRKIRIGRDVALACLSDMELFEVYNPPITALSRNFAQMTQHAARLLTEQIATGTRDAVSRPAAVPLRVIERKSTTMRPRTLASS